MVFLFFIIGLVGALLAWKKVSKSNIDRGHNKFISHLAGGMIGIFIWFFILAIGIAIFEPKQNDSVQSETNKEADPTAAQQYNSDREALKTYLNAVNTETGYVDSIIQDMGNYLTSGDIYSASSSASKCIDAVKVIQLDLSSTDQLKPIELSSEENTDKLESAIQNLSLGYYMKKGYCEVIKEFLDTQKPSLVAEAEEKSNNAQSTIIGAVGEIMTVASEYKLTFDNGQWVFDDSNKTK